MLVLLKKIFVGEGDNVCIVTYSSIRLKEKLDVFNKTTELDGPSATAAAYPALSVALSTADIGECRARFTGTLVSEPVCDDCDVPEPIFPAMPDDYEFSAWSERTVDAGEITSFTLTNGFTAIGATETVTVDETSAAVTTKPAGSTFNVKVTTNASAVDTVVVKIDTSDPSTGFAVGDRL